MVVTVNRSTFNAKDRLYDSGRLPKSRPAEQNEKKTHNKNEKKKKKQKKKKKKKNKKKTKQTKKEKEETMVRLGLA